MKAELRCKALGCDQAATVVVIRRNAAGRPAGGLRACQKHAQEEIDRGAEFSFDIPQPTDNFHRRAAK